MEAALALCFARALYNYAKQETNELDLTAGDLVHVLQQPNSDWWYAPARVRLCEEVSSLADKRIRGAVRACRLGTDGEATGLFPASYVELIDVTEALLASDPRAARLSQRLAALDLGPAA